MSSAGVLSYNRGPVIGNVDATFRSSISKPCDERNAQDLAIISSYLKKLEALCSLRDSAICLLANTIRYEYHDSNEALFKKGTPIKSWYILLSGSVFIDSAMFLPRSNFGKRAPGHMYRSHDCLILEPSELLVIDYTDVEHNEGYVDSSNNYRLHGDLLTRRRSSTNIRHSKSSFYSDTSSAYYGSDVMQNSNIEQEIASDSFNESESSSEYSEPYFCGTVRESLEKESKDRNEDDIENIVELIEFYPVFSQLSPHVRREIAKVVVLAVVKNAGTVVLNDKEAYDSWTVIINGEVENTLPDGTCYALHVGNRHDINLAHALRIGITIADDMHPIPKLTFGIDIDNNKRFHSGVMKTLIDDCQFLCVAKADYLKILEKAKDSIHTDIDQNGKIILVKEVHYNVEGTANEVVLKGTTDALLSYLLNASSVSNFSYVDDYLLTYRIFTEESVLCNYLMSKFSLQMYKECIANIFLLWVNNYYCDFKHSISLSNTLENFLELLRKEKMDSSLRLLSIACTTKANLETVVISRSHRNTPLNFDLCGGLEKGYGIFIKDVVAGSKASVCGIRKGQQILDVNGIKFEHINLSEAFDILKNTTHLSLTVKLNLIGYFEMLNNPDRLPPKRSRSRIPTHYTLEIESILGSSTSFTPNSCHFAKCEKKGGLKRLDFKKALKKYMFHKQKREMHQCKKSSDKDLPLSKSRSISELSDTLFYEDEIPGVIKVYRTDDTYRYLPIHKETTVKEAVMLALTEFDILDHSGFYCLSEVSVENGVIRQKRLPDSLTNIADKLPINARYYLKCNRSIDPLLRDDVAADLMKELEMNFLQLPPEEIAAQLTLRDFALFSKIEPVELLCNAFNVEFPSSLDNMKAFSETVNREMYWVITEIVKERNILKRAKIIKNFIKIAKYCREMKNFNSMFAIISGLDHKATNILTTTWERVPEKFRSILMDLQSLLDPSKNMLHYRALFRSTNIFPPMIPVQIPMFPVCIKDLTFIHEGNETITKDGLDIASLFDSPTPYHVVFSSFGYLPPDSFNSMFKNRFNLSNFKRIYEEAFITRKTKAYLNTVEIIEDEQRLIDIANYCESCQANAGTLKRKTNITTISDLCRNAGVITFGTDLNEDIEKNLPIANLSQSESNDKSCSINVQKNSALPKLPKQDLTNGESKLLRNFSLKGFRS